METRNGLPESTLERILAAGVLAPAADNHHEFRFSSSGGRIVVETTAAYRAASAQTRLLASISYGAVVENMLIAASACGWQGTPRWFPSQDAVCEIDFSPADNWVEGLAPFIPLRHTNRRFFSGPPLGAEAQAALAGEVAKVEGVKLIWLDAREVRRDALRLMRLAEGERFRIESLHHELFSSLRFDVGFGASCAQGIPPGATEVEVPLRPMFRLMRHWPAMRALNLLGAWRMMGWRAADLPARFSPHLVAIAVEVDDPLAAARAGAGLERAWLKATQLGLEVQPLVAAAVFAFEQFDAISMSMRERMRSGWRRLAPGTVPYVLLRLGHAPPPTVRSGRPPLSVFLRATA